MKKLLAFSLTVVMALSISACKKSPDSDALPDETTSLRQTETTSETVTAKPTGVLTLKKVDPSKIAVVYLDMRKGVKETAQEFASALGCVCHEIVPQTPYPEDDAAMLARAEEEFEKNMYPALSDYLENASGYLAVIAVYPELNGNLPMAIKTFFEDYDFRRTAVLPVCVCSGENAGESFDQIKEHFLTSPVYSGLEIHKEDDIASLCAEWIEAPLK